MESSDTCQNRPSSKFDENHLSCSQGLFEPENIHTSPGPSDNVWSGYRPRGSLARALHEKVIHDQYLSRIDKNEWYQCDLSSIHPDLSEKFVQLGPDQETIEFLEESESKSDWILTQIWHMLVKMFLGWFMTQTSINGHYIGPKRDHTKLVPVMEYPLEAFPLNTRWLQRGSMFVVSQPQLLKLLKSEGDTKYDSLLDLGAGDGKVTAHLAPLFEKVYVTEIAASMKSLLQKEGYQVLDPDHWFEDRKFDIVSCLNLIDRCDTPLDLLEQIKMSVKPDGLVLLAVVLPFSAYVESGSSDHKPQQLLPIKGDTFEDQVQSIVNEVLIPAKFEVLSWSRVPYLCEGDLQQSYYWLDDVIFVLKVLES